MQESINNLQRIRELAVQSANATNSDSDRASMQSEVNQLVQEMTRISQDTEFNGIKLLDGSFDSQNFQVGANGGESIDVSIRNIDPTELGTPTEELADEYSLVSDVWERDNRISNDINLTHLSYNDSFTIVGPKGTANIDVENNDSMYDVTTKVNNASALTGVSATAKTFAVLGYPRVKDWDFYDEVPDIINIDLSIKGKEEVRISSTIYKDVTAWGEDNWSFEPIVDAINATSDITGISATLSDWDHYAYLTSEDGHSISADELVMTDATGTVYRYSFPLDDRSGLQIRKVTEDFLDNTYTYGLEAGRGTAGQVDGNMTFKAIGDFTILPGTDGIEYSNNNIFWTDDVYDAELNRD